MSAIPQLTRAQQPTPKIGMVHLGPGAFFRAFNAVYTDDAMAKDCGDWGICAVSLRSPDIRDKMVPQDNVYNAVTLAAGGAEFRLVRSIANVKVAPEDPASVLAILADPAVRIVSMTITEKGYCHDPATGALRVEHPDIVHDLAHPDAPKSAIGFVVHALALRKNAGVDPFTVLSCDNLPDNGSLTRRVTLAFACLVDSELAGWIADQGRFPATMVDRITPATTQADVEMVAKETGFLDRACVMHEPFRQWVIEDNFVGNARPSWEAGGAQFVTDVAPFEAMKLRCLNGTHSTLAYLGYLAGYQTIAQTVADDCFAALLDQLWHNEIIPTVPQPQGEDLPAYCAALKKRYENPMIQHRTWQIAMDGSQKLPQRLLATITDNLAAGRACPGLILAVAGWMRYVGGVDEAGQDIDVKDPMAKELHRAFHASEDATETVDNLLGINAIFDVSLAQDPRFRDALVAAFSALTNQGARGAVKQVIGHE